MRAVFNGTNGHLRMADVPVPEIKSGEVLLRIYAAGINRADLLQRAGQYPPPPGWPDWFGLECAGVIEKIGAQAAAEGRWHTGDKVCALLGGGGYADYAAVPAGLLMPVPHGISLAEAAALPEAYAAAYLFLFTEGGLKAGNTLLMTAGAGGVASVVIPMAKAFGARVLTTVLNDEQEKAVAHLCADIVVNTSKQSLAAVMKRELEAGRGVDIAVDCLGGADVGKCLPCLSNGGRWIMIATLAGDTADVDLRGMYVRHTRLIGTTLRSRSPEEKAALLEEMTKLLWPKVESGEIRPTIGGMYPLEEAEKAQDLMRSGLSTGKMVLLVRENAAGCTG